MKIKPKATIWDKIVRNLLLYGTGFGWLAPIWIEEYRWRLFFTWFGVFILTIASENVERERKELMEEKKE
jgi:hypothetical protein